MSFDFDHVMKILEFFTYVITIGGFLYGGWKWIITPIKNIYQKLGTLEKNNVRLTEEVLPVIQSLSKEFSKNSGKSIMDRILRIDDNTRLAELRSKLIASNLMATCMLEYDRSGMLTWANKAFIDLTGLDFDQLQSNGWFVTISEDDRERVWNLWRHALESNIPFESEFVIKNQKNNNETCVKCIVFPHKSVDASAEYPILGYYGTLSVLS